MAHSQTLAPSVKNSIVNGTMFCLKVVFFFFFFLESNEYFHSAKMH